MELTSCYRAAPGCCTVCASSGPGPVIDLAVPDRAVLHRTLSTYLCADCAMQIAGLIAPALGQTLVPADYVGRIEAAKAGLEVARDGALARADKAEGLLAGLREAAFS